MAAVDLFAFLAPELANVLQADRDTALALGLLEVQGWVNVPPTRRDEAQALYAAWLLTVKASGGGYTVGGSLLAEKEGDLQRQYAGGRDAILSPADIGNYKARFNAIRRLAGYGAILARTPQVVPANYRGSFPWL